MGAESEKMCKRQLAAVEAVRKESAGNIAYVNFKDNITAKITFLEEGIFRYTVDPSGEFAEYAKPRDEAHVAKIQQYPDSSDKYSKPEITVSDEEDKIIISSGAATVIFDKDTAKMQIRNKCRIVMEEAEALEITDDAAVQIIVRQENENFYGGGTQNGRFVHNGKKISIVNESSWTDGGVASPSPFYFTTNGYGVLRNTFAEGTYDFGNTDKEKVIASHKENKFDAYYFVSDGVNGRQVTRDILRKYYKVTGNPILLPEYGFYEGHLNCYNRDAWSDIKGDKDWKIKGRKSHTSEGRTMYESGMATGYRLSEGQHSESLNGERPTISIENYPADVDTPYKYSARAVLDDYVKYDMPLGYFLPNDGYGGGYGQNGYYVQGGVNEDGSSSDERIAAVDANVANFASFTEYANSKGVASGLWTESNLAPDSDNNTYWHLLRDFKKEVEIGGATTLKTDVAWVGPGYSFQLNGVKTAYDIVTTSENFRPNIISLDGWAGSQRFNSVWTGDQTGGNWEYIRFHIPTYIGSSLSGNPNIGSDMDGIFGGKAVIAARDYQWKSFTPQMLNMDGWGSFMKAPYTFGDPYTGINRMYMKMKSKLMPYIYTTAVSASNIDTGNDDTGLPMVRAMFLEYPEDNYAYTKAMQYQFMLGSSVLVAPVYQETKADEIGNDVRNNIYLPDKDQVWVDYLTGEKIKGGQVLNNFDAPLWKLPVFVKNGAILPLYEENNTPEEVKKANRIVEFWPSGDSEYTVYEDDGKYICNETEEDSEYGVIGNISYGSYVSTKYTSSVKGDTAVLTVEASEGSYDGYNKNRSTIFVANVSRKPEEVIALNGSQVLKMTEVASREEFEVKVLTGEEKGEAVFFYDAFPRINTYASKSETEFAKMVAGVKVEPKIYVKLSATDTQKNAQIVKIKGFANEVYFPADQVNEDLAVPELAAPEDDKTPTSIILNWTKTEAADTYELLIDGILYTIGNEVSYLHEDLEYNSEHSYCVRARNAEGYSKWSEECVTSSKLDPWRNEVGALGTILWEGGDELGALKNATDHDTRTMFHSTGDVVTGRIPFIYDFGNAYELDYFEYYPRDNYGNGTVHRMNIYSSLDGVHWNLEWNGAENAEWTYDHDLEVVDNVKKVPLTGIGARFLKLEILKSVKNIFSANEIAVYKKDGSNAFAVGSTNKNETVAEGDYTNMKNYLGTSVKDGAHFVDQIQKRFGDINMNGVFDVYDYTYTMFKLDGGTKQTGAAAGEIKLVPGVENVKAGEIFTIEVLAENVENLNAFGKVMDYNPDQMEFVTVTPNESIEQMENLTVNKKYNDGTAYVNLAFANRGDKALYNGNGCLAVITMKAIEDICPAEVIQAKGVLLIGPKFDVKVS